VKYSVAPVGSGVASNALTWFAASVGVRVGSPPVPPELVEVLVVADVLVVLPPKPPELDELVLLLELDELFPVAAPPAPLDVLCELDGVLLLPQPVPATPAAANTAIAVAGPARCQNKLCLASLMRPPMRLEMRPTGKE
jgi:hypothetical protein